MRLASRTTSRPSRSGDLECHVRAPLGQPHLQRLGQCGCGAGGDHADDDISDSAHGPVRARRLALAEMTAKLGFAAKPVLQGLNVAVLAIHSDMQIGHGHPP